MEETVLILGVSRYNFENDEKERVQGVTAHYIMGDAELSENRAGFQVAKASFQDVRVWNDLGAVPGFYKMKFNMRPNAQGRIELRAASIKYLAPAEDLETIQLGAAETSTNGKV